MTDKPPRRKRPSDPLTQARRAAIRPHVDGIDTERDDALRITRGLPAACRSIMALRLQGYTREEIATRLKMHPESVHNRLKEINRRLALLNPEAA